MKMELKVLSDLLQPQPTCGHFEGHNINQLLVDRHNLPEWKT